MSLFTEFLPGMRIFLGDLDPDIRQFDDAHLTTSLGLASKQATGMGFNYAITPDRLGLTPDVTDPNDWMLLLYYGCYPFAVNMGEASSYRTRSLSESVEGKKCLVWRLETEIYRLETRSRFTGWQDMASWAASLSGVDAWLRLAELKVQNPPALSLALNSPDWRWRAAFSPPTP